MTHAEYDDICRWPGCYEVGNWFWNDGRGCMAACFGHFKPMMDETPEWVDKTIARYSEKE